MEPYITSIFTHLEGTFRQGITIWNLLVFLLALHNVAIDDIVIDSDEKLSMEDVS